MRLQFKGLTLVVLAACVACAASVAAPKATEGIRTLTDTVYYPVYGKTPREWISSSPVEAARAGILVPHLAMTAFASKWVYTARTTEFGCEPHGAVVLLGISFVMPRLASDSAIPADGMASWQGRMRSLWVHEKAHAKIAIKSAIELRDSLRVLHSGECGLLNSHIGAVSKEITARYSRLQDALDQRERQGAGRPGQIAAFRRSVLAVDTTFRDSVP